MDEVSRPATYRCAIFPSFHSRTAVFPDETTILSFRPLVEQQGIASQAVEAVNLLSKILRNSGSVSKDSIVDATIIEVPRSTKNAAAKRGPEMRQGYKKPTGGKSY